MRYNQNFVISDVDYALCLLGDELSDLIDEFLDSLACLGWTLYPSFAVLESNLFDPLQEVWFHTCFEKLLLHMILRVFKHVVQKPDHHLTSLGFGSQGAKMI